MMSRIGILQRTSNIVDQLVTRKRRELGERVWAGGQLLKNQKETKDEEKGAEGGARNEVFES